MSFVDRWRAKFLVLIVVAVSVLFSNGLSALSQDYLVTKRHLHRSAAGEYDGEDLTAADPISYTSLSYLPIVQDGQARANGEAIWLHDLAPWRHEIVLFRREIQLDEDVPDAEIRIFADTRYELWLDGQMLGRGPARFSQRVREYDVYSVKDLEAGEHLLAVLVQWAPNNRRSESDQPFVQGSMWGITASGLKTLLAQTDNTWKCRATDAWNLSSEPVHAWGLIGPTELMDLRKYETDWFHSSYEDGQWSEAIIRENVKLADRSRSIPPLATVPITPTVLDRGLLSPGKIIGELPGSSSGDIDVVVSVPTTVTFESVSGSGDAIEANLYLDGNDLSWGLVSSARPGVWGSSAVVTPGLHRLSFSETPQNGQTLSVFPRNVGLSLPFRQGKHAGRRLLLAEPVADPEAVVISDSSSLAVEVRTTPAYLVLDLGRTVHGRLEAEVEGPSGTIIDVGWDERLWQDARPLPYPGPLHPEWNQVDSWILDGQSHTISTIDARAGRYVLIAVWGTAPVILRDIWILEERYPVTEGGSFHSSDELLDRIWQTGVDTLYPNMTDAYTDTPWRERGQWWGDAYVESKINEVAFGDTLLLARGLHLMSGGFVDGRPEAMAPNGDGVHMLDYGMLWVQSLVDYWSLTGDRTLLIDTYPALLDFLGYLGAQEEPSTGLLNLPPESWSQTALIDWLAPRSRYGQSTALNSLYYRTLLNGSRIADALGRSEDAIDWSLRAGRVKSQVNKVLYNPDKQCYEETLYEEVGITTVRDVDHASTSICSPHAQAWALAYQIVPASLEQQVAQSLIQNLSWDPTQPNVEIYGMFWVLEGLANADRHEEALALIRRYYGYLLEKGASTWWEGFSSDERYTGSLSHGWGGSPTWHLTTHLIGASITGLDMWEVAPAFRGVDSAQGALPLSRGDLDVSWKCGGCGQYALEVDAPLGSHGRVILSPVMSDTQAVTVTQDGIVVWRDGVSYQDGIGLSSTGLEIPLQNGGKHSFRIDGACYPTYLPLLSSFGDRK